MLSLLALAHLSLAAVPAPGPAAAPKGVYALPASEFTAQAKSDLAALRVYANGLRRIELQLKENAGLFSQDTTVAYSPEQKQTLLTAWGAFFSYVSSAEALRQRYWNFVKELPHDGELHTRGFLLTHTALTIELARGLTFADLAAGNKQVRVLFDEKNPEFGIPAGAFAQLKLKVIHVATTTQLLSGDAYLGKMESVLKQRKLADEPDVQWALQETRLDSQVARERLLRRGLRLFAKNAADIFSAHTKSAIFPAQKDFAEWAGDTRVWRIGKPLIKREQVVELLKKIEPGDVVVARQNWFLSNIGLPGFWPHAELYLSTPDELAAYFNGDPEVAAYVATLPGKPATFTSFLQSKFPEKWKQYATEKDYLGYGPIRLIEAISEGVSFTSLEHGMVVDYVGVMRPRLTKADKARAIVRAFGYHGRPYDFDFDFFSDSTLVCTELVYKSYAPDTSSKGIRIPLVNVAGRMTLPANELVRLFDAEYDKPDRQFDFVGFLDGQERGGNAIVGSAESFRKSYRRVKWDVAQK